MLIDQLLDKYSVSNINAGKCKNSQKAILQLWMEARLTVTLFWYKPSYFIMEIKLFLC